MCDQIRKENINGQKNNSGSYPKHANCREKTQSGNSNRYRNCRDDYNNRDGGSGYTKGSNSH